MTTAMPDLANMSDTEFASFLSSLLNGEDGKEDNTVKGSDPVDALLASIAEGINQDHSVVAKPVRNARGHRKHNINLHHPETDDLLASLPFDC